MMEKITEIFTVINLDRNIEEWIILDARGLQHSTYQKRILGAKAGG
ncbi:MAG: hypothetical protein ABSA75_08190 [Candidatus Bathyarchaeia archaeon]|jgi:hypothetical protein